MQETLTIQERLKDLRVEYGLTLEQLAQKTGLSKSALGSYEADDCKDISHTAILTLARFYGVATDYLLGLTEVRSSDRTGIDELHINDEMIALLKSERINNRLLCELATHPDFPKLLADMEIYVDGIASMQVQSLNAIVDAARTTVMEKYQPSSDDKYMRLLEAAQINETGYFSQIIHGDMDIVLCDIKEAHRGDSTSAPEVSIAEELKKDIAAYQQMPGSPQARRIALLCSRLGINYSKLTREEFKTLIGILNKSKHFSTPKMGRRNKRR